MALPKPDIHTLSQVDASNIDIMYFETPYFVVPENDSAEKAFVVIREALRETKKIGIANKRKSCGWDNEYLLKVLAC